MNYYNLKETMEYSTTYEFFTYIPDNLQYLKTLYKNDSIVLGSILFDKDDINFSPLISFKLQKIYFMSDIFKEIDNEDIMTLNNLIESFGTWFFIPKNNIIVVSRFRFSSEYYNKKFTISYDIEKMVIPNLLFIWYDDKNFLSPKDSLYVKNISLYFNVYLIYLIEEEDKEESYTLENVMVFSFTYLYPFYKNILNYIQKKENKIMYMVLKVLSEFSFLFDIDNDIIYTDLRYKIEYIFDKDVNDSIEIIFDFSKSNNFIESFDDRIMRVNKNGEKWLKENIPFHDYKFLNMDSISNYFIRNLSLHKNYLNLKSKMYLNIKNSIMFYKEKVFLSRDEEVVDDL